MATPNVGILTNAGKNLIDRVNAGQTKITFSKIVFSSMNNNQLTDDQIKALTTVAPQEIVVNNPEVTLDNGTGETRIRATGNNKALTDGVYVKTYAVYAKDDSSNEILYGITVSPNPNYLPEYDGVTPQAVTYSYKVNISNTSNITFGNSDDIYVSDTDLAEALQPYAKTVDVNQQLDKKVNIADMRKPASDVLGMEDVSTALNQNNLADGTDLNTVTIEGVYPFVGVALVNAPKTVKHWGCLKVTFKGSMYLQELYTDDDIRYFRFASTSFNWLPWATIADDSKVAHLSGANNFDTVPTVNNNPLLLASSLPSDLARTGSDQEFTGKNTFDTAPIDKTTGHPYITKDGVPSDVARTGQPQTFTAQQTFSIAPVINDASTNKGGNQAATMADLKSVEKSAWHPVSVSMANFTIENAFYKKDNTKMTYELFVIGRTDENGIDKKGILFQDPEVHNFDKLSDYSVYGEFGLTDAPSSSFYGGIMTLCSTAANKIYYKNSYSGYGPFPTGSLSFYGYIHIVGTFN